MICKINYVAGCYRFTTETIQIFSTQNQGDLFHNSQAIKTTVFCSTMSAKAISEQTGKEFLYKYICTSAAVQNRFRYANVTTETDFDRLAQDHPWLLTEVRNN
ncbi:hypothetical protein J4Q44_G00172460 [Coregonus suidteri]|uniref:Uncharacterized protein n=1 Tax=Coregonus suidteri TaxID=861788 RepID=A0AAN8LFU4_9TELE